MSNTVLKARFVFKLLAWLFAVCIVLQVFFAGLALFWDSAQWASHTGFAKFLMIPPVLMLITSFFAKLPLSRRLSSAGLIVLIILMFVSAKMASSIGYLSALHPVIALMLFMGAVSNARKTNATIEAKQQESTEQVVMKS
ncbi:DUF6220 domain-containing protein [Cohnella sp. REN36]|uniref:DUF6220 domain-containing protein n=1 Tax=Cohnella sp. REN36 TaxID=2887347 RepID=UPI001D138FC6|nr:DUF6220 domain-containing protein [Cohnella sp. REN36]MCC3373638.1 DUF6220 domain-containing protein [Cohnella sp. REN36]